MASGAQSEAKSCSNFCLNCRWDDWSAWTPCSKLCAGGKTNRCLSNLKRLHDAYALYEMLYRNHCRDWSEAISAIFRGIRPFPGEVLAFSLHLRSRDQTLVMPKATTGAGWSRDLKSPELEKALHHKWLL